MIALVKRDERDRTELARRRELLALPMVPLSRPARAGTRQDDWPDARTWSHVPEVVGIGPGGELLGLFQSRDREDRTLVSSLDGEGSVVVLEGTLPASVVQPLPGGRILLVGGRAAGGTVNAQVWDGSGRLVASAFMGDAIAHVLTTPAGSVWIGYFDEALDELGAHKLVRFDDELRPQWSYPVRSERPDLPDVFDVYSLNVSAEVALCYAYDDFHLIRAHADSVTDLGSAGVRGAQAVLIDGPRGAFIGGYGPDHDLITPFRLGQDGVDVGTPVGRLVLPDGRELSRPRFTARGAELHVVVDRVYRYRVTLEELLDVTHG